MSKNEETPFIVDPVKLAADAIVDVAIETKTPFMAAKEFVTALDETDLISQIKQLKAEYQSLLPVDPYAEDRRLIALKIQEIQARLQSI